MAAVSRGRTYVRASHVACSLALAACRFGFQASGSENGDAGSGDDAAGDAAIDDAPVPGNLVFVTSVDYDIPALGSAAAADAACAARASSAGLDGTFIAWVSTTTAAAGSRLGQARGWVRRDGLPVADMAADLLAGRLLHPIRLDELGNDPGRVTVFTGTSDKGTLTTNCGDLMNSGASATYGVSVATTTWWTSGSGITCTARMHLYCLEVARDVPISLAPPSGRIAFITKNGFTPGGGMSAADNLCKTEATGAGLTGSYLALLATSSASAASRFQTGGAPWVRPDGVVTASSAAALLAGMPDAPPNVLADGSAYVSSTTWGGASSLQAAGDSTTTCQDWTSTVTTERGYGGWSSMTNADYFASVLFMSGQPRTAACDSGVPIYCLQE